MTQDPAGLLERIPELEALCVADAAIRRAVESGDPFKVYRALTWARLVRRLPEHREALRTLTRNRRLFARPLKGSPHLGTYNGFGTSFVGASERDAEDGTHIAVHAIVAFFAIPLLPLGAYVVQPGEHKVFSSSWHIFARVPLSWPTWLWTRAVALTAVAAVGVGASAALWSSKHQDLYVLNGLPVPLTVKIGARDAVLAPRSRQLIADLDAGRHAARAATKEGVEIDRLELTIDPSHDVAIWNVAGAAPLFRSVIRYTSDKTSQPASEPQGEAYCGQRFVALDDVDYLFTPPAQSVSMSSSEKVVTRTYVDVSRDAAEDPASCAFHLSASGREKESRALLATVARLEGWPARRLGQLVLATPERAEALPWATETRKAHPDNVDVHRLYQDVALRAGPLEAVLEEYRVAAEARPDSAVAQYLHARLLAGRAATARVTSLVERFPNDPNLLRMLVYRQWVAENWGATLDAWERLRAVDPATALDLLEAPTTAWVAQGRSSDALSSLRKLYDAAPPDERSEAAELYARVTLAQRGKGAELLLAQLEHDRDDANDQLSLARGRAGLLEGLKVSHPAAQLLRTLRKDPAAGLAMAAKLPPAQVSLLGASAWALAYAEAVRAGDAAAERVLSAAAFIDGPALALFRAYVRGEPVVLDDADLLPSMRAAADFARARGAVSPQERQRLLESARRHDVLRSPVSDAIEAWQI